MNKKGAQTKPVKHILEVLTGPELETAKRLYKGQDVKICNVRGKVCHLDCQQFNCPF